MLDACSVSITMQCWNYESNFGQTEIGQTVEDCFVVNELSRIARTRAKRL